MCRIQTFFLFTTFRISNSIYTHTYVNTHNIIHKQIIIVESVHHSTLDRTAHFLFVVYLSWRCSSFLHLLTVLVHIIPLCKKQGMEKGGGYNARKFICPIIFINSKKKRHGIYTRYVNSGFSTNGHDNEFYQNLYFFCHVGISHANGMVNN